VDKSFNHPLSSQADIQLTSNLRRFNSPIQSPVSSDPKSKSKLLYDWWFTANQFVLASSPLRPTTRDIFYQLNSSGNSPYVTSSLTRWRVCLLWICLAFRQVYISHIYSMLLKMYSFCTTHKSSVSYRADHAYLTYFTLQQKLAIGFPYIDSARTAYKTPLLMYCCEGMFTAPCLLLRGADHTENTSTILLTERVFWTVYKAAACQRVDQICYNINEWLLTNIHYLNAH
jgi:hypothetical protein